MPCESMRTTRDQTSRQRVAEVRAAVERLDKLLRSGVARAVVGPQGAMAFAGWDSESRAGVTDACAYRKIMATGSALARAALARAEQLAGRRVDRAAVAAGVHSHDGGATWGRD